MTHWIHEAWLLTENPDTKQVEDWESRVAGNEELRVAVDLMRQIEDRVGGEVYIVGGTPRDILLGVEVDDVDLATNNSPEDLEAAGFQLADISKATTDQPVYMVKHEGIDFELARFRTDSQGTTRQSNVATTVDSFQDDTARRDLTINSLGLDSQGRIVDWQGGIQDILDGVVRTVGDPRARFSEDTTRILRAFRFAAKSGFKIHPETLAAIEELRGDLDKRDRISPESIAQEIYKAAKSGKTLASFIEMIDDSGVLDQILPELVQTQPFKHEVEHHPEGDVYPHIIATLRASRSNDPVVNIGLLFHDLGKAVTHEVIDGKHTFRNHEAEGVPIVNDIFNRLKFNNLSATDKDAIRFVTKNHMIVHNLGDLSTKKLAPFVNSPHWPILRDVAYADEASRLHLFDAEKFEAKIAAAEGKIQALGDAEELRRKIKAVVDGRKLMNWFPDIQGHQIGKILGAMQGDVITQLEQGGPEDGWAQKRAEEIYQTL